MSHEHTLKLGHKSDIEIEIRCATCGANAIFDLTGKRDPHVKLVDGKPDIDHSEIEKWMGPCTRPVPPPNE